MVNCPLCNGPHDETKHHGGGHVTEDPAHLMVTRKQRADRKPELESFLLLLLLFFPDFLPIGCPHSGWDFSSQLLSHMPVVSGNALADTPEMCFTNRLDICLSIQSS
jgi:hypothetical protein